MLAILKRTVGFATFDPGELLDDGIAEDLRETLLIEFPPLSPIDRERQEIQRKRDAISSRIDDLNAMRAFHKGEIGKIDIEHDELDRIFAGLKAHEAEITDKPAPQKRRGKEAVAA